MGALPAAMPWNSGWTLEQRQSEAKAHWSLGAGGGLRTPTVGLQGGGPHTSETPASAGPMHHLALLQTSPRDTHNCHMSQT